MDIFGNYRLLIPRHSPIDSLAQLFIAFALNEINSPSFQHLPTPFTRIFGHVATPFFSYRICHHNAVSHIQHRL